VGSGSEMRGYAQLRVCGEVKGCGEVKVCVARVWRCVWRGEGGVEGGVRTRRFPCTSGSLRAPRLLRSTIARCAAYLAGVCGMWHGAYYGYSHAHLAGVVACGMGLTMGIVTRPWQGLWHVASRDYTPSDDTGSGYTHSGYTCLA